jgi:hypothetical protein
MGCKYDGTDYPRNIFKTCKFDTNRYCEDNFCDNSCPVFLELVGSKQIESKSDPADHPSHYADKQIEVIDYIKDTLTKEQYQGYCLGNVIKYISRYQKKNGREDLKKAAVYLRWLTESLGESDV